MASYPIMSALFVSHASADRALVDEFVDSILRLGTGVSPEHLFYTSGRDSGVPSGQDLNAYVRGIATDAEIVIAVITPEFASSPYCLAELGAAWASVGRLFPLLHPAMSHNDLDGVLRGVAVRSLGDAGALDELHDRITQIVSSPTSASTWGQYRDRWLAALPRLTSTAPAKAELRRLALPPAPRQEAPAAADGLGAGRFSWGTLFDSFVDAALYMHDEQLARNDIEGHIRLGTLIPSRYHYSSDSGADNWLRMCAEPTYRHHINTTEFWADSRGQRFAAGILAEFGTTSFDFVSLGPGDGQKDAEAINFWLTAGADVFYYPYDVSLHLAARAVKRVRERTQGAGNGSLHIKAVLADFRHFRTMREVFGHRDCPNLVALLGSVGNLERELSFLRSLRETMRREDLAVIEVRLKSDSELPELLSASSLQHDFGPLEYYLGMQFDASLMRIERRQQVSTIARTDTVVVSCRGASRGGAQLPEIRLQYIHLYEAEAFLDAVRAAGFEVVDQFVDTAGAFLECLLRRSP
jgi:hypothetical protein